MTGIALAIITITKVLTDDDIVVCVEASTPEGDSISLVDALGMIEFGKVEMLRQSQLEQDAE